MSIISNNHKALKNLYLETLHICSLETRTHECDDDISSMIFEDLNIGLTGSFFPGNLQILRDISFITEFEFVLSLKVYKQFNTIQHSENEWSVQAFRKSEHWKYLLVLLDLIKYEFANRELEN